MFKGVCRTYLTAVHVTKTEKRGIIVYLQLSDLQISQFTSSYIMSRHVTHTHILHLHTSHPHVSHLHMSPYYTSLSLRHISPSLCLLSTSVSLPLRPSLSLSLSSLALAISSCPLPFCLWEMQPVPWIACVKWKPTVNTRTLPGIGIRPRQFWTHTQTAFPHHNQYNHHKHSKFHIAQS